MLDQPITWVRVLDRLSQVEQQRLDLSLQGAPEHLGGNLSRALLAAASAEGRLSLEERLLLKLKHAPNDVAEAERDRVDRRTTLLRVANMRDAVERELSADEIPDAVRSRWEGEFIKHDSRVLGEGWLRSDAEDTWFLFEKNDRRLYVLEAHPNKAEKETGGDLVYLRAKPETAPSMVVVQYKRLVASGRRVTDASCRVDDRFENQMNKLAKLGLLTSSASPSSFSANSSAHADNYRLSTSCGFVKLIESREKVNEGHLYHGLYLPVAFLQQLIDEAQTTPLLKGKKADATVELDLLKDRFIDAETFVRLISDGWVGSSAATTVDLMSKLYASGFLAEDQPHTIGELT